MRARVHARVGEWVGLGRVAGAARIGAVALSTCELPFIRHTYVHTCAPTHHQTHKPKQHTRAPAPRLASVASVLQQSGSLDEMLESEEHLSDQLESLPYLCRRVAAASFAALDACFCG